jgi:hypothetical protein
VNRYIIQYHSKTLAALAGRKKQQVFPLSAWTFNYPNLLNCELKMVLHDLVGKVDNINFHKGLIISADIKANSEEEAVDISSNNVETLLSLISFCTLTFCEPARLVSIISILDANTKDCPFKHYVYPFDDEEKYIGSLSVINEHAFGTVFGAYDECDENSYKPRVLRALSWLRKGIGEKNSVDEFVCCWIGLETIKHLLSNDKRKHWNILEAIKHIYLRRRTRSKKRNVGDEWVEVEKIFHRRLNRKDFKKIKQAGRNGLLHGFRPVDKQFVNEITGYVGPIRKTLIFCLGSILGLEDDILLPITNKTPRRIRKNPWSILKGVIRNIPEDFEELVKNYPTVDAKIANKKFSITDDGKVTMTFEVPHHFRGPDGVQWKVASTEFWGDKDTGIENVEVKG